MASRPVFVAMGESTHLVEEIPIDFHWNPGFAPIQKRKNILALHEAASKRGIRPILEVSTKSDEKLGQRLSAFNLKMPTPCGDLSVESAYQGSKLFRDGGPYTDIYKMDSWAAKKDARLKNSGPLIGFDFFGQKWPLIPKTAFYDWLYLSALEPHQDFLKRLFNYRGFTDIEFNPEKSINCQARTCALLVSLIKLDALKLALRSQSDFIAMVESDSFNQAHSVEFHQHVLI